MAAVTTIAYGQGSRGISHQPIRHVEWVSRDLLHANGYNPNHVAPPELRLLKLSILEDGWTQPIVARADGEIVDGFHRWLVAADPAVAALTDGLVPVVRLRPVSLGQQMLATIRHNRARGSHHVLKMAEIVRDLVDGEGMAMAEVEQRLQMEDEEVDRLYDRGGIVVRAGREEFNHGWVPK